MPFAPMVARLLFPCHLFAVVFFSTLPALAQQKQEVFDAEKIVITFYKTGGTQPNFEKWITEREPYRTTPLAIRPEVMEQEMVRLKNIYHSFNPAKDLIVIRTNAIAEVEQRPDPVHPGETIPYFILHFPGGDADYFPYDFMGERFAVIPKDLTERMASPVPKEQYVHMRETIGNGKPVIMMLELRPLKANMEAPFDMDGSGGGVDEKDGKGQWMFLTDIATMSVWTKKGGMLWEYTAPWYMTPVSQDLLKLHTDKSTPLAPAE